MSSGINMLPARVRELLFGALAMSRNNQLEYTIQRICPTKRAGAIKASAYVCFGPMIVIAKVIKGPDGLFVGWPAGQWKTGGRTQYWPWVKFTCDVFRQEIEDAVLKAFSANQGSR